MLKMHARNIKGEIINPAIRSSDLEKQRQAEGERRE